MFVINYVSIAINYFHQKFEELLKSWHDNVRINEGQSKIPQAKGSLGLINSYDKLEINFNADLFKS